MSTYAAEAAKAGNAPVLAMHISGLPYIWWSIKPTWEAPTGFTHIGGLTPVDGCTVESEIDTLGSQIESPSVLTVRVQEDAAGVMRGLAATQLGRTAAVSCPMYTASLDASATAVTVAVDGDIADAQSSGTIYIGTETLTYGYLDMTGSRLNFRNCDRGRYHHLDASLDEVPMATQIAWDSLLGQPPLVSILPTVMRGRWVTIMRSYVDPSTGDVLAKGGHAVLWRGRLSMLAYVGGAWEISAQSLMAELEGQIALASSTGRTTATGWSFQSGGGTTCIISAKQHAIALDTRTWVEDCEDNRPGDASLHHHPFANTVDGKEIPDEQFKRSHDRAYYQWNATSDLYLDLTTCDSVADIVRQLNDWLAVEYTARRLATRVAFAYNTGSVSVMQQAAGLWLLEADYPDAGSYWSFERMGSGTFTAPARARVWTEIDFGSGPLAKILGFEDRVIKIEPQLTQAEYSYSADAVRLGYTDPSWEYLTPDSPPLRTYVAIPPETSSTAFTLATETSGTSPLIPPGDGSPIILRAEDVGAIQVSAFNTSTGVLTAQLTAQDDVVYAVGGAEIEVADGDPAEKDIELRQAWRPTYRTVVDMGSGGVQNLIAVDGVHTMMLRILTSTGSGIAYNGAYDVLVRQIALAIPGDFIDVASFEHVQDYLGRQELARDYLLYEPISVSDLFAAECRLLGIGIVQRAGQIAAVHLCAPSSADAVLDVDNSVLTTGSQVQWTLDDHDPVCGLSLSYDRDTITGDMMGRHIELLQTEYGASRSASMIEIEAPGLRRSIWSSRADATDPMRVHLTDLLSRASCDRWIYRCTCNRLAEGIVAGDVVTITDARIPDPRTGSMGVVALPGVVCRSIWSIADGTVELDIVVYAVGGTGDDEVSTAGAPSEAVSVLGTVGGNSINVTAIPAGITAGSSVTVYSSGESTQAQVVSAAGTSITLDRAPPGDLGPAVVTSGDVEAAAGSTPPAGTTPYLAGTGKVIMTSSGALKVAPKVFS